MKFTDKQIESLREQVSKKLSSKRFVHVLGVEKMAAFLGEKILPNMLDKLRVATLLHDISKEYSEAEHLLLAEKHNLDFTEDDMSSPVIWHSLTAGAVIVDEFSEYADEDVLSSVANHTVGKADMSLFDEIVFIADYVEEGRTYEKCVNVRTKLLDSIAKATSIDECILALHEATVASLNNTIDNLTLKGCDYHKRTKETLDSMLEVLERQKMEITKDLINCDSTTLAREAVKVLLEKKALDVKLFDVREKSGITDYYINVTGRSMTQVASLADDIDDKLSERGRGANRIEGKRGNGWILVDFGDLIINVFDRSSREFYNLDKHFPEDSIVDISDLVTEVDKKFEIKSEE